MGEDQRKDYGPRGCAEPSALALLMFVAALVVIFG